MASKKNNALTGLVTSGAVNLDQIVQYLSTWKGTDNFLEVLSHVLKIVIPILHLGARLQQRAGFRKSSVSSVGEHLAKLSPLIGDSRMLFRVWGILPIIQWLLSHSKYPHATSRLLKLERWQIFMMLAYFPTEQLYYLRIHDIIPAAITLPVLGKTLTLNTKKLLQASSRFYLAYIVLEFFRLKERFGLLCAKQKALSKTGANNVEANAERVELKKSWKAHQLATAYNTFRFPGALHWSLESGISLNDVTGAALGLAASLITFRGLWAAAGVILPPPPPSVSDGEGDRQEEKEARAIVKEVEPYAVETDTGVSESTSSYVEVKATQV
ncbi:hypothetical protein BDM02DRAFT_3190187 [Thelephora ganbajun]|uniref:Uncharacterized protein n=1 Tax=Thelephora ganbajun TaxID=370292 RepID=A0ACB6Z5Q8_THEGA|nr:hypothetical protein BDM02DRAFT_3190187 [Thelephora ganbajun]